MITLVRKLTAMVFHTAQLLFSVLGQVKMQSYAGTASFAPWGTDSKR